MGIDVGKTYRTEQYAKVFTHDGSTDSSISEQEMFFLRFVREVGQIDVRFAAVIHIEKGNSSSILKAMEEVIIQYLNLKLSRFEPNSCLLSVRKLREGANAEKISGEVYECLRENELDVERICGIATDGAAVMVGRHIGVVTHMKELVPDLGILCKAFQSSTIDFSFIHPLLRSTVAKVEAHKLGNGLMFKGFCTGVPEAPTEATSEFKGHVVKDSSKQMYDAQSACIRFCENPIGNLESRFADKDDSEILSVMCGIFDSVVFAGDDVQLTLNAPNNFEDLRKSLSFINLSNFVNMIYVIAPYDYFKIITIDPYYYSDAVSNLRHDSSDEDCFSIEEELGIDIEDTPLLGRSQEEDNSKPLHDKVKLFYCRDDISRMLPHARYSTKHGPARVMAVTLKAAHLLFSEENPAYSVSLKLFQTLRARNIRLLGSVPMESCLCVYCTNIRDLLEDLKTDLEEPTKSTSFFQHLFTAFWQYSQFKIGKSNPEEESAYQFIRDSIIFLSDDIQHDRQAVKEFTLRALELLKQKIVISKVTIWSDGAASQYKGKGPFMTGYNAQRCYYGSEHGKGESDGETGVLSQALRRAVHEGFNFRNARDMVDYLTAHYSQASTNSRREFDSHCRERFSLQPIISGDVSSIVLADIVPADVIPSQDMKDDPQGITRLPPISPVKRTRQVAKCHSSKAKSELDSSFLANEIRKANTTISVLDRKHDRLKRYYKEKEKTKSSTQPLDPADQSILDLEAKLATKDAVIFELQNEKLILEEHIKEVEADVKVT
ncbi:hypothetical protein GQR58_020948 [Nymphon striatum]|nr:hypothetical protein GQR58_020948 [Nymphon striatum]